MAIDGLPTSLWLEAHLTQVESNGRSWVLIQRGETYSGAILLKLVVMGEGAKLLAQSQDLSGQLAWFEKLDGRIAPEAEVDAVIAKAKARDPDLWIVEISGPDFRNPLSTTGA